MIALLSRDFTNSGSQSGALHQTGQGALNSEDAQALTEGCSHINGLVK
jgi:hypothetical protein